MAHTQPSASRRKVLAPNTRSPTSSWKSRVKDLTGILIIYICKREVLAKKCLIKKLFILLTSELILQMVDHDCFSKELQRQIRSLIFPALFTTAGELLRSRTKNPTAKIQTSLSSATLRKARQVFRQKCKKKYDPHIWRNIPGVISSLLFYVSAPSCCLFLFLHALACLVSPYRTEWSMQSPIQKVSKCLLKINKETKLKSLVRRDVTELTETLQREKRHLLSMTSAARNAALTLTLTFLAAS